MKRITGMALAMILVLALSACGGSAPDVKSGSASESFGQESAGQPYTCFIKHSFYDGIVTDEESALQAIESVKQEIHADENTEFVLSDISENQEGTCFYSFQQAVGGIQVHGSIVKLIVDKEGKVSGLVSSLMEGLELSPDDVWEIDEAQAEAAVLEAMEGEKVRIINDATQQTILPSPLSEDNFYVWVVYTDNPFQEYSGAYLAHYVKGDGTYLDYIPVREPGNSEALSGSVSLFAFDGLEEASWTGNVTYPDGNIRGITVPLMVDEQTGTQYLGDLERRILLADDSDFYNNETLTTRSSTDGTFNNEDLIMYYTMIKVYDFYDQIGWHGPDGQGTPTLILSDLRDDNGEPLDNAYYSGKAQGFQIFRINRPFGDCACLDVMAHEYTHCVTENILSSSLYYNDLGAINEALSDIQGSLIEIMYGDSPGGEWELGEHAIGGAVRSLNDPHKYGQPANVWDHYYVPGAIGVSSDYNDLGGVHRNSSLLSLICYRLYEAGMPVEDLFYYWMNVSFCMTPRTDYVGLAEILPWCMEMMGYQDHLDALNRAIEETRIGTKDYPDALPEDCGMISFPFSDTEVYEQYYVTAEFIEEDDTWNLTWPSIENGNVTIVLPAGEYRININLYAKSGEEEPVVISLSETKWVNANGGLFGSFTPAYVELEAGNLVEPVTDGLTESIEKAVN